jgi:cobalamin biosynthetic protein CobC
MTAEQAQTVMHGGDLDAARRQFPDAPEPWIDLSTGINPNAYPLPELSPDAWTRLPQTSDEAALRRVAAERYGAPSPEMIISAPGTQALIQIVPRLLPPARVAILGPTYGEHAAAWQREGHEVATAGSLADAGAASVVVVVNPNNPTGRIVETDALRGLAQDLGRRNGLLVVDEAFADVMPRELSIIPDIPPATVALRSFGKTYGLAGLRLGFAVAGAEIALRLRDMLGPWAVSGPALHTGRVALADDVWLARTRAQLEAGAARLDALLAAGGFEIVGGTPLFRLARHASAQQIADGLGGRGIHVRRFPDEPAWLRLGLPGGAAEWQRLEAALRVAITPMSTRAKI